MMVGTARKPESLDAALRRPGRLSYDVTLPHPDVAARQDILHKLLMGVTHTLEETDIADIAKQTPGYEGGDLRNMVVEGVMQTTPQPLTQQHLHSALAVVKPVSLKESSTVTAQVRLSDIHGYETLKSELYEAMDLALKEGRVFQQCGLSAPSRFLLFGPPGCGKSTFVKALATSFHLNVIPVKRSTILGKYFGESEQNLTRIFNLARASAPCIIHFENFEGLGGKKKLDDDDGADVESRIINHLKVQLDGIVSNEDIFIFAETNRPDLLNTDLIRPGRFHEYHLVDLPDASARQQLFHHHLVTCHFTDAHFNRQLGDSHECLHCC